MSTLGILLVGENIDREQLEVVERTFRDLSVPGLSVRVGFQLLSDAPILKLVECYETEHQCALDQVWLFCQAERSEVGKWPEATSEIERFLKVGGGVFVSADHGELGSNLGENILWLRQIRRWGKYNAPTTGTASINTIEGNGKETDSLAKRIFPSGSIPTHLLLRHSELEHVRWLPDHQHEGDLSVEELGDFGVYQSAIEDVAFAVGWQNSATRDAASGMPHKHLPRLVPVLKCFDPKNICAEVPGPIVADSTFHHWMTDNLREIEEKNQEAFAHWRSLTINILAFLTPLKRLEQIFIAVTMGLRQRPEIAHILNAYQSGDSSPVNDVALAMQRTLRRFPLALRLLERHAEVQGNSPTYQELCLGLAEKICANH